MNLFNPGLRRIWGLDPDFLRGEPHVREVLPRVRPLFNVSDKAWPVLAERMAARTTDPDTRTGRNERNDGTPIDWEMVPLHNRGVRFRYVPEPDHPRLEPSLLVRNQNLELAALQNSTIYA